MRTIYRDVEALSAAGVPIHMERGPNGGIVVADHYRHALAQFSSDELQALFAAAAGPMADLGISSHASALQKLAGALPEPQRRTAERSRDRLLLDHNRWYRGAQPTALLATLRQAASDGRSVRISYRDRVGAVTDRVVDPLGLVAKAGIWYLVAREGEKGYRSFRAERIERAESTRERFERPAGFDLDAYWQASVASMERYPATTYTVTLRVREDAVERLLQAWSADVRESRDGFATVRVPFYAKEHAIFQIIALGDAATILDPLELRQTLVDRARAATDHHARGLE